MSVFSKPLGSYPYPYEDEAVWQEFVEGGKPKLHLDVDCNNPEAENLDYCSCRGKTLMGGGQAMSHHAMRALHVARLSKL